MMINTSILDNFGDDDLDILIIDAEKAIESACLTYRNVLNRRHTAEELARAGMNVDIAQRVYDTFMEEKKARSEKKSIPLHS